jgi:hypothetical protein
MADVEYQIQPELFKAPSESIWAVGLRQDGPPAEEESKLEGQRVLLLPISQKLAPPAGQVGSIFGIINKADDGPANTAIKPHTNKIVVSQRLRRLELIAFLLYQKTGVKKKLISLKAEAAPSRPKGSPSFPRIVSYRMISSTILPREATISNS